MRRFLKTLVFGCGLAALASPAYALTGRVVDQRTGAPIAGAEVSIVGLSGSTRTDADGRFTWKPEPVAPFEVLVVLPGGRVAKLVRVESFDASTLVTIQIQPLVSEEVSVTSGVAPSIEAAPGAGMTLLSGREVQSRNPANLMQALENVPGVNQVSEGQAAVPAVRGLARGRTLILIDGARVTSERRAGPSATFMDPGSIVSVDIARGPGSVAYGSDALGGVISVRTPKPKFNSPLGASALATFGAGIPDRRGTVEISKGFAKTALLVQGHLRESGDYEGPDAPVLNSGWGDHGFLLRAEQQAGRGQLSLGWQSDFGRDVERPRNNSAATRFYYPFENSHRFTAAYALPRIGGFESVKFEGFLGSFDQRTDQDRVPSPTVTRRIERADMAARDLQVRATADTLVGRGRIEFGLDLNGRYGLEAHDILIAYNTAGSVASTTDNLSIDSARRLDAGAFLQGSVALTPAVFAAAGARVDRVTNENVGGYFGDRSISHSAAAGFGAVTLGPFDGFSLTGQVARGFRDPTLSDRFFRGPSGRGFVTGNPDLEPESSLQLDLGARYVAGRLRFAGYLYHYRITSLIERYTTEPDFFFLRNRGRAQLRGAELEAQADLGRGFVLELSAQAAGGRALDDNAALDDVSPYTVTLVARRTVEKGSAYVRFAAVGRDDRPGPSEIAAPGHRVFDAGASWRFSRRVELRATGRNLLNRTYYASPDPRFVFAPGRNGSITAVVKF